LPNIPEVEQTPRALAARALSLVHEDPDRARTTAQTALDRAGVSNDLAAASTAERALGLVCRESGAHVQAESHLRRAVSLATQARSPALAAEGRLALVSIHAMAGRFGAAMREGDLAVEVLHGADLARAQTHLATVLRLQGRLDEALTMYRTALRGLRGRGDSSTLANLYNNRAVTQYHAGNLASALADFEAAEKLVLESGSLRRAAQARQSCGIVMARQGDLPAALAAFARADEYLGEDSQPDPLVLRDRAIVLLAARLVAEAHEHLRRAVAQLEASGPDGYLAEVRLLLAEAALLDGHPHAARVAAEQARQAFVRQRRPAWAALAHNMVVRSAWVSGDCSPALLRAARRTADELDRAGFLIRATDARLLAGRIALALGHVGVARRQFEATTVARRRGPVEVRAAAWHAEALLRLQDGDRRGARSALRAGMGVLDRYRAAQGATELRVHAAEHGAELAAMGIRLAFEDGDPGRILAWSERCRAMSLRPRAVRPPRDPRLAADLSELRRAVQAAQEEALAGRPTSRLMARQAAFENRVRDRARQAGGQHEGRVMSGPSRRALVDALGDRALVEIVEHEGVLYGVVLAGGRLRLRRLAAGADVAAELDRLRFSLRRLAQPGSQEAVEASRHALEFGLKRLDGFLIDPVAADVGQRELVIVPTGALHALPWPALPSLGWRPVALAPSAAVWHAAATAEATEGPVPRESRRIVLIAGPGLPCAAGEVAALSRRHRGAVRLSGGRATTEAALAAADGADLVHVAAHGRFRTDNPLFSSVDLADGAVTVYDLEGLQRAPRMLVLSACDSGLSEVRSGDELMGLTASLLALGTRTVVATTCPVPDDSTRRLMLEFHAGLASGLGPSRALARAQRRAVAKGPKDVAAAVAFMCFGLG
jgi:tetratricopeptide (TPR) repeat protein